MVEKIFLVKKQYVCEDNIMTWKIKKEEEITKDTNGFIEFKLRKTKTKTQVWEVIATQDDVEIGLIKWYPIWRHYCFFPNNDTVFSDRCQLAIGLKIMELNEQHKKSK